MTSYFKGFGTGRQNGQFWYAGSDGTFPGFLYKKKGAGGAKRNPVFGLICGRPAQIWNKYTPGAGVGATNTAVRRAKMRFATSCNKTQTCGVFYAALGQNRIRPSQFTTYASNFTL